MFQRRRVDQLLNVLTSQFPPKIPQPPTAPASESARASQANAPAQQNGTVKAGTSLHLSIFLWLVYKNPMN